jgi:hypothetical protein
MCLAAGAARAESPEQSDPPFHFLRYNDDFSNLAGKKDPTLYERLKYLPLGSTAYGPIFLSLGGELRERFETYQNPNFGIKAPPSDAYLLQRFAFNADLHITDYFRAFATLGDNRIFGERGVSSSTDTNRWDMMQGFAEVRLPSPFGDDPSVRYGREEMAFGFQRLIAAREGPNVRRDFDGLRITDKIGEASVDILAVQPTVDTQFAMNDSTNRNQHLGGVYIATPVFGGLKVDAYALGYENTQATLRGVKGDENLQTYGVRAFGKADGFDWNFEYSQQSGSFGTKQVQAFLAAGVAGYTFENVMWRPRIGLSANDASGDNSHSNTIGTFNAMFPRLPYFAETSLLVPSNIKDIRPVFTFRPAENVEVVLGLDWLRRASMTDGLYGSGFVMFAGTNKVNGMRIGTEPSIDVRWQYNEHLQFGAILADLIAGPALEQVTGKNMIFGVLFAKFKF